jgi:hypothetical protein
MPLIMDHVSVEIEPDVEDIYLGGGSRVSVSFMIPIEAKMRSLGVKLLYEVCRVQKLSVQDLSESCSAAQPEFETYSLFFPFRNFQRLVHRPLV